jgi:DNA-binding transcriptional ArsR family regulator
MRKSSASAVAKIDQPIMSNSPPEESHSSHSHLEPVMTPRDLGRMFYALGDLEGNKIAILSLLIHSERTVTEIANYISLSDSATSQQLSKLKLHGFLDSRKGDNQTRIYSLRPGVVQNLINAVSHVLQSYSN